MSAKMRNSKWIKVVLMHSMEPIKCTYNLMTRFVGEGGIQFAAYVGVSLLARLCKWISNGPQLFINKRLVSFQNCCSVSPGLSHGGGVRVIRYHISSVSAGSTDWARLLRRVARGNNARTGCVNGVHTFRFSQDWLCERCSYFHVSPTLCLWESFGHLNG
jgi:hypothetical protein